MNSFKLLVEKNDIQNLISNKYKGLKLYLLQNIDYNNKEELINALQIGIDSLENSGKNVVLSLQTVQEKITFITERHELIDSVLKDTDWYYTSPNQLDINNLMTWLDKAIDTATLYCSKQLLTDLQ